MAETSAEVDWELAKENVQPIKRGRKVRGLHMQDKSSLDIELEESNIKDKLSTMEPGVEKLAVWLDYLTWARASFPSSSVKALEVLESCTNDLKGCKELRNNPQFVKIWIEYADLVQTPGEIFSFMQANKIGVRVALFWIAWAFVAEKLKNYGLTDKIFQKGIKMQAEPKHVMTKRYQQFQRRLARHYINMAEEGELEKSTTSSSTSSRKPLSQVGQTTEQHTTARTNSIRGSKDNFTVFQDIGSEKGNGNATLQVGESAENVEWKSLGANKDRSKENAGVMTKWNDAPLQNRKSSSSLQRQTLHSQPGNSHQKIDIFVDPDFDKGNNENNFDTSHNAKKKLTIREKLDKGSRCEQISKNPLALHNKEVAVSSQKLSTDKDEAESNIKQVTKDLSAHPRSGVKIFSGEAALSINDPLNNVSTKCKRSPRPEPSTQPSTSFKIFSDEETSLLAKNDSVQHSFPPSDTSTAKSKRSDSANQPSTGFKIFSDETTSSPVRKDSANHSIPPSNSSARQDARSRSDPPNQSSTGFKIFSDETTSSPVRKDSKQQDPPTLPSTGFKIFSDERASYSHSQALMNDEQKGDTFSDRPSAKPMCGADRQNSVIAPKEDTEYKKRDKGLSHKTSETSETDIYNSSMRSCLRDTTDGRNFSVHQTNVEKSSSVTSVKSSEDVRSNSLDDIDFNFLDTSAGENETINTKLAKIDIDQMFCCDPTPEKQRKTRNEKGGARKENFSIYDPDKNKAVSPLASAPKKAGNSNHNEVFDDSGDIKHSHSMVFIDDSLLQFEPTTEMSLPACDMSCKPDVNERSFDIFQFSSQRTETDQKRGLQRRPIIAQDDIVGAETTSRNSFYLSSSSEEDTMGGSLNMDRGEKRARACANEQVQFRHNNA